MGMNPYNPIETLSLAIGAAIHNEKILPSIEYEWKSPSDHREGKPGVMKQRRPDLSRDIQVVHFPQSWGSTALGFGGMGGAAITSAYTTIVMMNHLYAAVFFGGEHAYSVKMDSTFRDDMHLQRMPDVSMAHKKYESILN